MSPKNLFTVFFINSICFNQRVFVLKGLYKSVKLLVVNFMEAHKWGINKKTTIWGFVVLFTIFLEYFVHLYLGIEIIYSQFFYVLIAMAGFWYGRKVIILGIFLAIMTISNTFILTGTVNPESLFIGLMFILVASVVGELAYNAEKEHCALIAYISEAAMRLKNPAAEIKENLITVSSETKNENIKAIVDIQIKNAGQILDNIDILNEKIVEKHRDIPDEYQKFLKKS